MRERPILFSGPMVCAILDGTKTQTRRVLKPQPRGPQIRHWSGDLWRVDGIDDEVEPSDTLRCPYGQPGDRLWVRETWVPTTGDVGGLPSGVHVAHMGIRYAADRAFEPREQARELWPCKTDWKPSIYMPRWASRLTLEVTGVRVQRVQEISEDDAQAEGVEAGNVAGIDRDIEGDIWHGAYIRAYRQLWDSINAARGFGWDKNPWVWVLSFKAISVGDEP